MLVSHKLKLIFLKPPKTAGTSVQLALARHCGPRDHMSKLLPVEDYPEYSAQNIVKGKLRPHLHAEGARRLFPVEWEKYLIISIVRNPWDRMVSQWWWKTKGKKESFDTWIYSLKPSNISNWKFYCTKHGMEVGLLLHYESLDSDWEMLCESIGVQVLPLPRAKSGYRKDGGRPYQEYYNPTTRRIVKEAAYNEIECFRYSFYP